MYEQFNGYYPAQQNRFYGQQLQRQEIIHVNGKGGAEAYQMAPNSNCLLLDDTAPIIWLKQTDGAGYPVLTPYSITPYQPEPQISTSEIVERIKKLEEMINVKPDAEHVKPAKNERRE